jgi:hypothetical protein
MVALSPVIHCLIPGIGGITHGWRRIYQVVLAHRVLELQALLPPKEGLLGIRDGQHSQYLLVAEGKQGKERTFYQRTLMASAERMRFALYQPRGRRGGPLKNVRGHLQAMGV